MLFAHSVRAIALVRKQKCNYSYRVFTQQLNFDLGDSNVSLISYEKSNGVHTSGPSPSRLHTSSKILHSSAAGHGNISRRKRRRRGNLFTEIDSTMDDRNHNVTSSLSAVKDRERFIQKADAFLDELEIALTPMKHCNDIFEISRSRTKIGNVLSIGLQPGYGSYIIQVDESSMTLTLNSPKSGIYTYALRADGEWAGVDDDHLLKGMLTRDLIQQCQGLPDF